MLIIKNGSEVADKVIDFAKKAVSKYQNDDCYFYEDYYSHLAQGHNLDHLLAFLRGDELVDLATTSMFMNIPVLRLEFCSDCHKDHKEVITAIHDKYGDDVLLHGDYDIMKQQNMHACSFKSSYQENASYCVGSFWENTWVFSKDKIYLVRDAIEQRYFQADTSNIEYKLMSDRELQEYLFDKDLMNAPLWVVNNGMYHVVGFHYFSGQYNNEQTRHLVAIADGVIVGCIKYGVYYDNHYGLNYIDVSLPYRRRGIAKGLIQELSRVLDDKYPLILSQESEMGKMCHMHDHFKNYQWKTKVYVENHDTYKYERIA